MKKIIGIAFLLAVCMLLAPLSAVSEERVISVAGRPSDKDITEKQTDPEAAVTDELKVCDHKTGEIMTLSAKDYIFGVVAAEMPALYHSEALTAQAVAAWTFACVRRTENQGKSYDITTDNTGDQSFVTREEAKLKWGSKAEEYTEKIDSAVEKALGYMITYKGAPITAVYHAVSAGKTEDAANVWGKEIAYLKPVSSEGDKLAQNYISEVPFTFEELKEKFAEEAELSEDSENLFAVKSKSTSGTVTEIQVAGKSMSGARVRSLLDLRSSCFEAKKTETGWTFTVYGYGHGVGMSQTGADYMAKQGADFKEILTHYYSGVKIEKIKT